MTNDVYRGIDMGEIDENYMKRCYELAISAGRKGFDTFGAVLVCDGKILEEAENTADFEKKIFGHAEFILTLQKLYKDAIAFPLYLPG